MVFFPAFLLRMPMRACADCIVDVGLAMCLLLQTGCGCWCFGHEKWRLRSTSLPDYESTRLDAKPIPSLPIAQVHMRMSGLCCFGVGLHFEGLGYDHNYVLGAPNESGLRPAARAANSESWPFFRCAARCVPGLGGQQRPLDVHEDEPARSADAAIGDFMKSTQIHLH